MHPHPAETAGIGCGVDIDSFDALKCLTAVVFVADIGADIILEKRGGVVIGLVAVLEELSEALVGEAPLG